MKRDLIEPIRAVFERAFAQRVRYLERLGTTPEYTGSPEARVRYVQLLLASTTSMLADPVALAEPIVTMIDLMGVTHRPDVERSPDPGAAARARRVYGFGAWCFSRAAQVPVPPFHLSLPPRTGGAG